mgnify:CR=1 FL=1
MSLYLNLKHDEYMFQEQKNEIRAHLRKYKKEHGHSIKNEKAKIKCKICHKEFDDYWKSIVGKLNEI